KAQLETTAASLDTAKTELQTAQASLAAEQLALTRFADIAKDAGLEVAQNALPSLRKVDDETFGILKTMASKRETPPPSPRQPVTAADDTPPANSGDSWSMEA